MSSASHAAMAHVGHHAANGTAAGALLDPNAPAAERLVAFMQRHGLAEDTIAAQLEWPREKLQAALAPDARKLKALPEVECALENVIGYYQVRLAAQTLAMTSTKTFLPVTSALRRSAIPAQVGWGTSNVGGVIEWWVDHMDWADTVASRSGVGQAIDCAAWQVDTQAEAVEKSPSAARKRRRQGDAAALAYVNEKSSGDMLCPVRLDIDVDGTRFQDALLLNAYVCNLQTGMEGWKRFVFCAFFSQASTIHKDAIAESIRRQLLSYSSFVSSKRQSAAAVTLHPIILDLVIDGVALRDQFEWDTSNDMNDAEKFAAMVFVVAAGVCLNGCLEVVDGNGRTTIQGKIPTLPDDFDDPIRDVKDAVLWQPVVSELSKEEQHYITAKWGMTRVPASKKQPPLNHSSALRPTPKHASRVSKENKGPRSINSFLMFCQVHKDVGMKGKKRISASETRKIMGDMWRKCTDEDKEQYAQMAEVENEKRRREHIFEQRDRAIAEWEEDEARRKGLLGSTFLETSTDHCRGILLASYMSERHEVDARRQAEEAKWDE
ncbi:TPA: hypothetical protein N0F65_000932 [Lagenidium giganteum]|uniref:HMG box domain-containing protein n=1 Tax=Lagenidium giganteum TaxID=4803 RepID=A0AAV2YJ89_9STRA|nr:TPA: hypothetical protein N0F65_000932 [Lagenidium giganteum]